MLRFSLLIICCCLTTLSLTGQKANPFGEGFQISLTLEPDLQRKFTLTPNVTAEDTLPLVPFSLLLPFRIRPDTIRMNGDTTLYWLEEGLNRQVNRQQAIFNLISRVQLRYRFGSGLELSGGFTYSGYTDVRSTTEIEGLPNDFYYSTSETRLDRPGFLTGLAYHFRKNSRLQPYVGLQLDLAVSFYTYREGRKSFPGLGVELPSEINERFRKNVIFDFDGRLFAGFNYQLSDYWAIGIEAHLSRYFLPVPAALQFRYRFNKKSAE